MIIKCPECGNAVSNMAGTCPKCGIRIAGNLVKCPQCGRLSLKGQKTCPLCKSPLPEPTASPVVESQAEQAVKETPAPSTPIKPRKRRGCMGWGCLLGILIVAGLLMGGFFYYTLLSRQAKEREEFQRLEGVTNTEFYEQFLRDYPDSEHAQAVRDKLRDLKEEARQWDEALKSKNRISLTRFQQTYPNSAHQRECADLIDSIDWKEAASLGTEKSVQNYMDHHPSGRYTEEAAQMMITFSQQKISDRDRLHIRGILDAFFSNGMARGDLQAIGGAIPGTMTSFCGKAQATPEQIAHFTSDKKAQDVIGIHYLINADMKVERDTLPDGLPAYSVHFSLDETVNRSDANQPSTKTYQVETHLNSEKKIVDMTIK